MAIFELLEFGNSLIHSKNKNGSEFSIKVGSQPKNGLLGTQQKTF